jgi:HEAT repeats
MSVRIRRVLGICAIYILPSNLNLTELSQIGVFLKNSRFTLPTSQNDRVAKKRQIWLAVLVVAAVGGLVWLALGLREPVYKDRALRVWLDQFGTNHWLHRDNDLDKEAQAAIRHFGTNEIPTYLKLMTARESRFRLKLMAVVPKRWQARLHVPNALAYKNELHQDRVLGAYGIVALGPEAKPCVPVLVGLLENNDPDVRDTAVFALRSLGPIAREALPLLVKCLKDPDPGVRWDAMLALGEIHQEPEQMRECSITKLA